MKLQAAINAVRESETKALVELYNHLTGKSIKKFQDRKTAENRVVGVLKPMGENERAKAVASFLAAERAEEAAPEQQEAPIHPTTAELDAVDPSQDGAECPHCGIGLDNGFIADGDDGGLGVGIIKLTEREYECHACGGEFGPVIKRRAKDENRSAAIAESWKDEDVKRRRAQRHAVRVDGAEYRSVKAAFEALRLPLKEHIKFRMRLKEEEAMQAYGFFWEVIER